VEKGLIEKELTKKYQKRFLITKKLKVKQIVKRVIVMWKKV
jgi:hypothetical protein